jgi:hypothetical protein
MQCKRFVQKIFCVFNFGKELIVAPKAIFKIFDNFGDFLAHFNVARDFDQSSNVFDRHNRLINKLQIGADGFLKRFE